MENKENKEIIEKIEEVESEVKEVKEINNKCIIIILAIVIFILVLAMFPFLLKDRTKAVSVSVEATEENNDTKLNSSVFKVDDSSTRLKKLDTDKDAAWTLEEDIIKIGSGDKAGEVEYYIIVNGDNYRLYSYSKLPDDRIKISLVKGEIDNENFDTLTESDDNNEIKESIINLLANAKLVENIDDNRYPIVIGNDIIEDWKSEIDWYCGRTSDGLAD